MAELVRLMPEKKELLSDRVHDQILQLIISNTGSDDLVLNEKHLMELLGVSKAPVREALIKLCSEGVLKSIPRFGYVVNRLTEKDVREVTRMRLLLEEEALKEGYGRIRESGLGALKAQIDTIAEQVKESESSATEPEDVWRMWTDNEEFHLLLASFSDNQLLMTYLKNSLGIQKRVYAQYFWRRNQSPHDGIDETTHLDIWEALKEDDYERALKLLRSDIAQTASL